MTTVVLEWVAMDASPADSNDGLLMLEFESWGHPLPRVGDYLSPPTGPMHLPGRGDGSTAWTVSSVTFELSSDADHADLDAIRVVIHESPAPWVED